MLIPYNFLLILISARIFIAYHLIKLNVHWPWLRFYLIKEKCKDLLKLNLNVGEKVNVFYGNVLVYNEFEHSYYCSVELTDFQTTFECI